MIFLRRGASLSGCGSCEWYDMLFETNHFSHQAGHPSACAISSCLSFVFGGALALMRLYPYVNMNLRTLSNGFGVGISSEHCVRGAAGWCSSQLCCCFVGAYLPFCCGDCSGARACLDSLDAPACDCARGPCLDTLFLTLP